VCSNGMLSLPTKLFRIRAALALALIYGLCVLAPSLAFAILDHSKIPFCLAESYVNPKLHAGAIHHDNGGARHHTGNGAWASHEHPASHEQSASYEPSTPHEHPLKRANGNPADCCMLFSMAGLFGEVRIAFEPLNLGSMPPPARADALHGRDPERINRPPIG
jgi:hypothetical protein